MKIGLDKEQNYERLFKRSLAGIFKTTFEGKFIDCNDAFAKILGYKNGDEILSVEVLDIYFNKEDRKKYLNDLLKYNQLTNYEIRHKRKNGSEVWILANISLERDVEGNPHFIEGTFIDITELKLTAEIMAEREEKFRQISSIISDYAYSAYWDLKKDNIITNWVFGAIEDITGYKDFEILEQPNEGFLQVIHPQDIDYVKRGFRKIMDSGEIQLEYRIITKSGELKWIEDQAKIVEQDADGIRITGAVKDITKRKKTQEDFYISQQSYKNLSEDSPQGILIIDKKFKVLYFNKKARDILQKEDPKSLEDICKVFLPKNKHLLQDLISRMNKGEKINYLETEISPGGVERWDIGLQSNNTIYGGKQAYQFIIHDISIQKELEREKLRYQIAEETNKIMEREIREHQKTQSKLKSAQKFTNDIINSSIDMIIATDDEANIMEVNKSALKKFGYSREEFFQLKPGDLYASKDQFNQVYAELESKGLFRGEVWNVNNRGEVFRCYLSASLIRNDVGEVIGAMGVSRDLTDIKKAERKYQDQNSKIRSIFESTSNMLIWTMDTNFNITSYNKMFQKLIQERFGGELKEGDNYLDFVNTPVVKAKNYDRMLSFFRSAFEGNTEEFEGPLKDKNGNIIWLEAFLNPIRYGDNEIMELACLAHDISEKKLVERQILSSEQKNRAIINALPDLIIKVDENGLLLESQSNLDIAKSVIGENIKIGHSILAIFDAETGKKFKSKIQHSIENDEVSQLEYASAYNDEVIRFFEARFSKINNNEVLVIIRDVTEKQEIENKIIESLKEKEILLKEVHHRVKNNLQIISSILNLQSSYVKDSNTIQILKESQNRIKSMSFIHEALYQNENFSRINFSDYILNLSKNLIHSYYINSELIETSYDVQPMRLSLDQAIPCGLIVNELVTNTLKYAFEPESTGLIAISLKRKDNNISLKIADNGVGLPSDFDPEETETLGIQLVKTLVEQVEGTMELNRQDGTAYLIKFEAQN